MSEKTPETVASRTAYLNGEYLPAEQAKISIFDRGLLFGDAVYEGCAVLDGRLVDFGSHMQRLRRSLHELDIDYHVDDSAMLAIHRELAARNRLDNGLIYLQITR